MAGHCLVLGKLVDFLEGVTLEDTHDERYRQKIARMLVAEKGFEKTDIEPRRKLRAAAGDKRAVVIIDFVVKPVDPICMIIKYGPGSIVTRRRSVLAASRLVAPYQVPIAVATNGEDAEILDGPSGRVLSKGLEGIPSKSQLMQRVSKDSFVPISPERAEMEARIFYCYEVDDSCPCDDNVCIL